MKKISNVAILLIMISLLILVFSTAYAEDKVLVVIEGEKVEFTDASPFIDKSGRVQVPVRIVLEKLGVDVSWDGENKIVLAKKDDIRLQIPIDKGYLLKNNVKFYHDTRAIIVNDRTYIPIRPVIEALGQYVKWDSETKSVLITKNQIDGITSASRKKQ